MQTFNKYKISIKSESFACVISMECSFAGLGY